MGRANDGARAKGRAGRIKAKAAKGKAAKAERAKGGKGGKGGKGKPDTGEGKAERAKAGKGKPGAPTKHKRAKQLMPKRVCCNNRPRCRRCPLRMLAEGTLPEGYSVRHRRLVRD